MKMMHINIYELYPQQSMKMIEHDALNNCT